jgi:putative ABC transport system permease protein
VSVPGRLFAIGLGVAGVFLGVAMVSSRLIGPLAGVLGWPGQRFGGVAGKLARRNAVRNPGRTASAAAALMIGLTLVTTVAVLGEGLRSSATRAVQKQVLASYVVTSANGFDTLPPAVGRAIGGAPGVDATSVRSDKGRAAGASTEVTGVDPAAIARFYRFRYQGAAPRSLAVLDAGGAIVRRTFAEAHHLRVDGRFTLVTPSGARLALRVAGILDQGRFDLDPLLGSVVIGQRAFDASFERASDLYTFVNVPEAYAPVAEQVLREGARRYPGVHVATRDAFVQSRVSGVSQILNLLYVLLGLSVVVSLFGMVNTLVLAVFERTRELGMLRAVGLTQRQARRMVRHESVITALIGAALGLPLGVGLAALVTHALEPYGVELRLPLGTLAAFVAVAVLAGVAAAIIPARRAARLDVLAALGYE